MEQNIKEAAMDYMRSHDKNFYAEDNSVSLFVGFGKMNVESIWYSDKEDKVYLHVGCWEFEGDIDIESLSDENQARMMEAFRVDTKRDKLWDKIVEYVEAANEHLTEYGIGAQIHIVAHREDANYEVYVLYGGDDVDVKDDNVKLEDALTVIEKVWKELVEAYADDAEDFCESVKLRRLSGDTHRGEANLVYSFCECPMFFVHERGAIEDVGDEIDRFMGVRGYFAVNAEDYHEAMRKVYKHEKGIDGN